MDLAELRNQVIARLAEQGFDVVDGAILPAERSKGQMRDAHRQAVEVSRARAAKALASYENRFVNQLAHARPNPTRIAPQLELIPQGSSFEAKLWRWISLHWSIPISGGYGRRMRFLVRDTNNCNSVIGIIGLTDPVFSLGARDGWIGWGMEERKLRLVHVMEAYALGAVPPYDSMLGGKLVAMMAASLEVRRHFADKYTGSTTKIRARSPRADLWALTTQSAFGRSALYNRISAPDSTPLWLRLGETQGSGDFHFSGEIYQQLTILADSVRDGKRSSGTHERWKSSGFRNRKEVLHTALGALGFDPRLLRLHGIPRGVYLAPFASNVRPVLKSGDAAEVREFGVEKLFEHWLQRWGMKAAARQSSSRESWRLY